MTSRVLITGGAGFIGYHLVRWLVQQGYDVRVLDNGRTGRLDRFDEMPEARSVTLLEGDLRRPADVEAASEGVDYVVHLAAQVSVVESMDRPAETWSINVHGTALVLETARRTGVRRVVFTSSCAVYGDSLEPPFRETDVPWPTSPYGLSKRMGEYLAEFYTRVFGVPVVTLRLFNVYGPGQRADSPYASVIPRFIEALRRGVPMTIYGTGRQTRDFVFVEDVVRIIEKALHAPQADGLVINVGTGQPTSVNDLARLLQEVSGRSVGTRHEPPRPGEMLHAWADTTRLESVLGVSPSDLMPLQEGLARTWMEEGVGRPVGK
ncbi:MAG: NAD-dependent epimerase/dehydratase family protein [Acidobacteria bacterium]|nr:NAD-dependent epimerase/dehydratase family protein [Acidobacteriota bacterium]MDW7983385.1 NAD-dependent epimerase/dehydratase family protein [Acidobacteriota bacterium]